MRYIAYSQNMAKSLRKEFGGLYGKASNDFLIDEAIQLRWIYERNFDDTPFCEYIYFDNLKTQEWFFKNNLDDFCDTYLPNFREHLINTGGKNIKKKFKKIVKKLKKSEVK